jgi:hypothetical protein
VYPGIVAWIVPITGREQIVVPIALDPTGWLAMQWPGLPPHSRKRSGLDLTPGYQTLTLRL